MTNSKILMTNFLMLMTNCLMLMTNFLMLVTNCLMLMTNFLMLMTNCLMLVTNFLMLMTNFLMLMTNFLMLVTITILMMTIMMPSQVKKSMKMVEEASNCKSCIKVNKSCKKTTYILKWIERYFIFRYLDISIFL